MKHTSATSPSGWEAECDISPGHDVGIFLGQVWDDEVLELFPPSLQEFDY